MAGSIGLSPMHSVARLRGRKQRTLDLRSAALIEGIDRVAKAKLARGLFP